MTYDLRKAIYQALLNDAQLTELVGDRIMQRDGLEEVGHDLQKPFLVFYFGYRQKLGPSRLRGNAQWLHVWAHQARGDYFEVDQILDHSVRILEALPNQASFLELRHLERSQDLEDDKMETNCRFDRYQAASSE